MQLPARTDRPPPPVEWPAWAQIETALRAEELQSMSGGPASPRLKALTHPDRFRYERTLVCGQQALTGASTTNARLVIRGHGFWPTLLVSTTPGTQFRLGRKVIDVQQPGHAVLLPTDVEITRTVAPGRTAFVSVHASLLQAEIAARRAGDGGPVAGSPLAHGTPLPHVRARWAEAINQHRQASRPGTQPLVLTRAEADLASLVADLQLAQAPPLRPGAVDARRLAQVEAWIDSHLGEAITLGRLCQVAGVGARCLQKGFEARRGMSPMRFVAERRLVEAHRRLSAAEPAPSVKVVALDLGFHHLGRFAESYRQLIGEAPSATRAAHLARAPAP